jgi:hypothetical protein
MADQTARIVRQVEARSFMHGPEHCREYLSASPRSGLARPA